MTACGDRQNAAIIGHSEKAENGQCPFSIAFYCTSVYLK
jgi:hypothetical protein